MIRLVFSLCILICTDLSAQKLWTLDDCISYAKNQNLNILRNRNDIAESEIRLEILKNNRLPDLSANLNNNFYFGRGISREGTYTDNNQASSALNVTASINVFNGGKNNHDIASQRLNLMASIKDGEKLSENISINITSLFLEVIFSKEILNIADKQVELSEQHLSRVQQRYEAGKSTKESVLEVESILASDKLMAMQSRGNLKIAMLDLMQSMNMKYDETFDTAPISTDSIMAMGDISEQSTIELALNTNPSIIAASLRKDAARHNTLSAKAGLYPRISFNVGYGNGYYHAFLSGYSNPILSTQLKLNSNQYIGLNINIPIFNRLTTRKQIKLARLYENNSELALLETKTALAKDIERAYLDKIMSFEKYLSAKQTVKYASLFFEQETNRYYGGKTSFYAFLEARHRLLNANSEMLRAQCEYALKAKILQYYQTTQK